METVLDFRRENLRALIKQWGGPLPLSKKLGYANASFLVQMAGPHPSREVSEKTARQVEQKLGLPPGWLDQAHEANQESPEHAAGGKSKTRRARIPAPSAGASPGVDDALDMGVVGEAIRVVGQTAQDMGVSLSPEKLASLVLMVYDDAHAVGKMRVAYVRQLLQLLK